MKEEIIRMIIENLESDIDGFELKLFSNSGIIETYKCEGLKS